MTTATETKKAKKLHSRAAFVQWDKGVRVKGEILRKSIKPSRNPKFSDQKIVQVMLSEPCKFAKKAKDKDGNTKTVKVEVAANHPVNVTLKGDCNAVFELPDGTLVDITCNGKEAGSDGQQYWAFDVEYEDAN